MLGNTNTCWTTIDYKTSFHGGSSYKLNILSTNNHIFRLFDLEYDLKKDITEFIIVVKKPDIFQLIPKFILQDSLNIYCFFDKVFFWTII